MSRAMLPALAMLLCAATAAPVTAATEVSARTGNGLVIGRGEDLELSLTGYVQVLASRAWDDARLLGAAPPDIAVRRARLFLAGRVHRDVQFFLHLGLSGQDYEVGVASPLYDAFVTWTPLRDLQLRAGQMKVPFDRQRLTPAAAMQLIDRSPAVRELTLDRDIGLVALSDDLFGWQERLGYRMGVFAGEGRNRNSASPGLLAVARVQYLPLGAFDASSESDLERTPAPRVAVGLALARHGGAVRALGTSGPFFETGRAHYRHATADIQFKWRGASALASMIHRSASRRVQAPDTDAPELTRSGWGAFLQSGVFVTRSLELAARYSELRPRGWDRSSLIPVRAFGLGVNLFVLGRGGVLQADYTLQRAPGSAEGSHLLRLQTQLSF